jgi:tetratricopeptide (TPR) repeat protein
MPTPTERPTEESKKRLTPHEDDTAELAIAYAKERQYGEALRYFRRVTTFSPDALSYYGLTLAMCRQQLDDAVDRCRQAVEREPIRGRFYYHLGQVYLARGEKTLAVRTFRLGLKAEPDHPQLVAALKKLGLRQSPVLGFLGRTHPVNKWLGWLRYRLTI